MPPSPLRRAAAFFACAAALVCSATAQPSPSAPAPEISPYLVRAWTTRDGLPVNHIESIAQTPDGYLWLGTAAGLIRFDGVRFRIYGEAELKGWRGTYVRALSVDRHGRLVVISTMGEVSVVEPGGRFRSLGITGARDGNVGSTHAESPNGDLWFSLWKAGAVRLRADGQIERYSVGTGVTGAVASVRVTPRGTVLAVTERGIERFDGTRFRVVVPIALGTAEALRANGGWAASGVGGEQIVRFSGERFEVVSAPSHRGRCRVIRVDPDGSVVLLADAGIMRLALDGRVITLVPHSDLRTNIENFTPGMDGRIPWTRRASLGMIGPASEGSRITTLPLPADLVVNGINASFTDAQGTLWVGTMGGLLRYTPRRAHGIGRAEGVEEPFTFAVIAARDGARYVGTWGGGVQRFAPGAMRPGAPIGLAQGAPLRARALLEDRRGRVWAAGAREDPTRASAIVIEGERVVGRVFIDSTSGANVIHETRTGAVYMGSGNLHRVVESASGFASVAEPRPPELDAWGTVWAIHDDARGRFWVGGDRGLFVRDGDGAPWRRVAQIGAVEVKMIHADAAGDLWIGTRGAGLVRLRLSTSRGDVGSAQTFVYTQARHGLHHDAVWWMQPDRAGDLWLTSDAGLGRYHPADFDAVMRGERPRLTPLLLSQAHGLPADEFDSGSPGGTRLADGTLWFPTIAGIAVVDPSRVRADTVPPRVAIESIGSDGQVQDTLRTGAEVRLPAGTRNVAFGYTGLDLARPEGLRFRVRLDGFDADWRDMGARREAFYSNLPPGTYTFRVQATNGDGTPSAEDATVRVTLAPFWWQTLWARLAALLIVLGAAAWLWRWKTLRMRTVELEDIVRTRTAQLREERDVVQRQHAEIAEAHDRLKTLDQAKSNLVANVSHEFRTPLLLMLGGVRETLDGAGDILDDRLRSYLLGAERAGERLERLVGHLLDTSRIDAGARPVHPVPGDLAAFAADVARAFVPLAERAGVALVIDADGAVGACFDAEATETILANLIGNAIKFTPSGGRVFVRASASPDDPARVCVRVRDTGAGIAAADLARIFDRFHQADATSTRAFEGAGLGLALSRDLAGLLGGTLDAASDGLDFGSTFTLALPAATVPPAPAPAPDPDRLRPHVVLDDALTHPPSSHEGDGASSAADAPDPSSERRPRILVVDDNADVRRLVRDHLAADFDISEAFDGASALAAVRKSAPDAIVCDVMMPGIDGLAFVRTLRADAALADIPVLLLTARAGSDHAAEGLAIGASDVLAKPYARVELRARVHRLVDDRREMQQRYRGEVVLRPEGAPLVAKEAAFVERARLKVSERLGEMTYDAWAFALDMGLSVAQLNRKVKPLTGFAASGFVRELRLLRAADLLAARAGTVREVSRMVGYTDAEHFSRLFRKRFDCPPSEWAVRGRADAPPPPDE